MGSRTGVSSRPSGLSICCRLPGPARVSLGPLPLTRGTACRRSGGCRGGVQVVAGGEGEGGCGVGLSPWQRVRLVVLPQAVKNMIPALVGQFISLFKDTSLTVIIGLTELVGTGRALLAITQYLHDV